MWLLFATLGYVITVYAALTVDTALAMLLLYITSYTVRKPIRWEICGLYPLSCINQLAYFMDKSCELCSVSQSCLLLWANTWISVSLQYVRLDIHVYGRTVFDWLYTQKGNVFKWIIYEILYSINFVDNSVEFVNNAVEFCR